MVKLLIDANLPRSLAAWMDDDTIYVHDLDPRLTDTRIWMLASEQGLTIVTKDADFSHRIQTSSEGPHVIHFRVGNMTLAELDQFVTAVWPAVCEASQSARLVAVYRDRIEAVG